MRSWKGSRLHEMSPAARLGNGRDCRPRAALTRGRRALMEALRAGPLDAYALAGALGKPAETVGRVARELVTMGLLRRIDPKGVALGRRVELTAAGLAALGRKP